MKVVFLDIDGVLNCAHTSARMRGLIGIDPFLVSIFNKIILETDAKIVLSSSWRLFSLDEVKSVFPMLYDVTSSIREHGSVRGDEIQKWLDEHPEVERYAILDDDSDMLESQMPNFFQTTWKKGITKEIVDKVIKHLYN